MVTLCYEHSVLFAVIITDLAISVVSCLSTLDEQINAQAHFLHRPIKVLSTSASKSEALRMG